MTLLGERDGVGGGILEEGVPGNLLWGIGRVLPLPVPCLLFLGCHSENSSALACSHRVMEQPLRTMSRSPSSVVQAAFHGSFVIAMAEPN